MSKSTDIRIVDVQFDFEKHQYRTPLKFGGVPTDHCILFNVSIQVQTRDGKEAQGKGSMPLGNVWAFPPRYVPFEQSLNAMTSLAELAVDNTLDCNLYAHPLELSEELEPIFLNTANELSESMQLDTRIPKLCTVVTTSPIDAAIHDAFGKANGINSYNGLDQDYIQSDLSHFLNEEFTGKYLDQYTTRHPKPDMPIYHLVGALDPLTDIDLNERLDDGLPETLPEWIEADGLTHLKIKLNGDDLDWDVARVLAIDKVTAETQEKRGVKNWNYSADFNETCKDVEYLLEFLNRIQETEAQAFERLAYIEQPTDRDLESHPENKMHKAAEIKPVVIDESLTDFETLLLARDQGYSGVALKACKGQSQALLMGAAAQEYNMFLAVQDLTCPGASFLHSAGLAARIRGVTAIEGNARQFCPSANDGWCEEYPSIFNISDGTVGTQILTGPGLGH
ncbi:mandelate racemase/muconate lactonizing enzyme family protein [Candidatus Poribacteria bacterium]|nr:mandelate racemase/muconate lactonizing enzyme family protein [Candidatus Poribacteria bacterium]